MLKYTILWLDPRMMTSQDSDLDDLKELLSDLGIDLDVREVLSDDGKEVNGIHATFKYDTNELKVKRTRNAGRHRKTPDYNSPLDNLDAADALDWIESHTVEEGMKALGGVSRAVYYRRKKSLKQIRDENPGDKYWFCR